jgi:urease accessory protein
MHAHAVSPAGTFDAAAVADTVLLDREDRHRRRMAMTGEGGLAFLLDLAEATVLEDGDGLVLEDGRIVRVRAAEEDVVAITAASPAELVRIAWHLGNRHLPTELHPDRLVIRRDHVIEAMVEGLGGWLAPARAPFRPEGGAYGLGAVHGHDHGHGHGHGHHDHGAADHHHHHHAAGDGPGHPHHDHAHDHHHDHPHEHGAAPVATPGVRRPVPILAGDGLVTVGAPVDDHGYCAPDEAAGGRCGGGHAHGG